jgi:hypothetical protein
MTKQEYLEFKDFYNFQRKYFKPKNIKFIVKSLRYTSPLYGINDDMKKSIGKSLECVNISSDKSDMSVFLKASKGSWIYNYRDLVFSKKTMKELIISSEHKLRKNIKFEVKNLYTFIEEPPIKVKKKNKVV